MQMVRIGLIGAGWHATGHHAPALRHCAADAEFAGAVELAGVYDVDAVKASAAARNFGFRRPYESVEAMASDVDAFVSIVPPPVLLPVLTSILAHGRPVLIEKPLGIDLAQTQRIAQLLVGHPHMVSLNRRFDPAVTIARRWMGEQSSPPRAIHGLMARHNRLERDFVWGTGIHLSDAMCFLAGPLKLTAGHATSGAGAGRVGLLSGNDGLRGTIHYHPACGRIDESVQLFGDDWAAHITTGTQLPWRVRCWKSGREEVSADADTAVPQFERNGTGEETRAFLRAVLGRGPFAPTVADAMAGTELAHALQELHDLQRPDPPR
jgi:predicted dehydrogenase